MVARVVVADAELDVVVEPGSAEGGETDVEVISRAGEETYGICNLDEKSSYVTECGTLCIINCDREAHARRIRECLVSIKISVNRA